MIFDTIAAMGDWTNDKKFDKNASQAQIRAVIADLQRAYTPKQVVQEITKGGTIDFANDQEAAMQLFAWGMQNGVPRSVIEAAVYGSPAPVSSGLLTWYDASQESYANGAATATWTDFSSNSNDASQGTANLRPLFVASAINGQPAFRFDGTDDYMDAGAAFAVGVDEYTIFAVIKSADGPAGATLFGGTDATLNQWIQSRDWGSQWLFAYDGTNFLNDAEYIDGNANIWSVRDNGTYVQQFKNGVPGTKHPDRTSYPMPSTVYVGAFRNFDGGPVATRWKDDIAEILVYDASLSNAQMANVNAYLGNKYGIVVP